MHVHLNVKFFVLCLLLALPIPPFLLPIFTGFAMAIPLATGACLLRKVSYVHALL